MEERERLAEELFRLLIDGQNQKLEKGIPCMDFISIVCNKLPSDPTFSSEPQFTDTYSMAPPMKVDDYVLEIQHKSKVSTPDCIISFEKIRQGMSSYTMYRKSEVKNVEQEYVLRIEFIDTVFKRSFIIKEGKFELKEILSDDGKKFLPYFN